MSWLSSPLEQYFASLNGFVGFLPKVRQKNRPLLQAVHRALLNEPCLTKPDLDHIENFLYLSDRVITPPLWVVQKAFVWLRGIVFTLARPWTRRKSTFV